VTNDRQVEWILKPVNFRFASVIAMPTPPLAGHRGDRAEGLAEGERTVAKQNPAHSPSAAGGDRRIKNRDAGPADASAKLNAWLQRIALSHQPSGQLARRCSSAETRAMPSHQRLGPDGCHCLHDRGKPPIRMQEEQTIAVRELDPTTHLALKHNQLTSEYGILSLKSANRPERRNQQPQKEEEQRYHRGRRYVIPSPHQSNVIRHFQEYMPYGLLVPDAPCFQT
jgi:hypothetical protein